MFSVSPYSHPLNLSSIDYNLRYEAAIMIILLTVVISIFNTCAEVVIAKEWFPPANIRLIFWSSLSEK